MSYFLRNAVDEMIRQGECQKAGGLLKKIFNESPTLATAQWVVERSLALKEHLPLVPCRLAVLRSFTLEPVVLMLRALAFLHGVDLQVHMGHFNAYAQEILNPESKLFLFNPQLVILAIDSRDFFPDLWVRQDGIQEGNPRKTAEKRLAELQSWVEIFGKRSRASLILQTFELPAAPSLGILDSQKKEGQLETFQWINSELRQIAQEQRGIYLLDYDALVARWGRLRWHDEYKWLTLRLPISADCLIHLAKEYLRFILSFTGKSCKVLAVDLDNTLWGGVLGEEGKEGIQLGKEYPGAAFLALQQVLLSLKRRGILLAIVSKNNEAEALEVLETHPAMIARLKDFAAVRINWKDKVENLRDIARELNLRTDSFAFLDDHPVEREWVKSEMPEVNVIELPSDPLGSAASLLDSPLFEKMALSQEDRDRTQYYVEERGRKQLYEKSPSLEDFYRSLKLEAEISEASQETIARAAQLTQKTNQFNLTTHRYTEQEIAAMAENPHWKVYCLCAKDRFGDNGLVGLALIRTAEEEWEIDTFLLSCRVIGRTLETALLSHIVRDAAKQGAKTLKGWYIPSSKNLPARDCYRLHKFRLVRERNGKLLWQLDPRRDQIPWPEWIACRVLNQETV